MLAGIVLGGFIFTSGWLGYVVASSLHEQGYSKNQIESARFIEKKDTLDLLKVVTTHGRGLYYLTHDMK